MSSKLEFELLGAPSTPDALVEHLMEMGTVAARALRPGLVVDESQPPSTDGDGPRWYLEVDYSAGIEVWLSLDEEGLTRSICLTCQPPPTGSKAVRISVDTDIRPARPRLDRSRSKRNERLFSVLPSMGSFLAAGWVFLRGHSLVTVVLCFIFTLVGGIILQIGLLSLWHRPPPRVSVDPKVKSRWASEVKSVLLGRDDLRAIPT